MELVKSTFVACPVTQDSFWVRSSPNPSLSCLWVHFTDSFRLFFFLFYVQNYGKLLGMLTMYVHFTNTDDFLVYNDGAFILLMCSPMPFLLIDLN